jgi:primosomal protein N' (replication factor Y)
LRRQRVQGIILDLYRQNEAGEWILEGDQPGAERPSIDRLRPDPEAPGAPDAPVLRDLVDVADPEAALVPAQVRLARWLSDYYRVPLYEALALMLPPGVSQEAEPTWRATPAGLAAELGALPERERAVLYFLRQRGEQTERDLLGALRGGASDLREIYAALQERGLATRGAVISSPRARPRSERMARLLVAPPALDQAIDDLKRAPKQRAVLLFLRQPFQRQETGDRRQEVGDDRGAGDNSKLITHNSELPPPYPAAALLKATGADLATLRALEKRQLLEITTREVRRDPLAGDATPPDIPPQLTLAQERAWQPISLALDGSYELKVLSSEFALS